MPIEDRYIVDIYQLMKMIRFYNSGPVMYIRYICNAYVLTYCILVATTDMTTT